MLKSILVTCICDFFGGDFAIILFLLRFIVVLLIIDVWTWDAFFGIVGGFSKSLLGSV